jgi:ankyrin repeat protein
MKKTMKKNNFVIGPGDGYSLLHAFAKRGRTTVVEYILDKGADPNARDNFNLTPLLRAVMEGHTEMARFLIAKGADIEATFEGNTSLIEATLQNNNELVKLLIENGACMEAKTKEGHTALHVAATNAYVKIVQTLFHAGAIVDTRNQKLITPLMSAALSNRYWMVELLITMGADVELHDRDGETALQLHQNKAASRVLALTQLAEIKDTPIARLLQTEMIRKRRMEKGMGEIVVSSPGVDRLEVDFDSDNLSSDLDMARLSVSV